MDWIIGLAVLVLGMAIGIAVALLLTHRKIKEYLIKRGPPEDQLKEVVKERAEAKAKQRVLQKSYSARNIDEATYVAKDAEYTHLLEKYDTEIEALLTIISAAELPEELKKSSKPLRDASDLQTLAKTIRDLEREKTELRVQLDNLRLQASNMEEDRKRALARRTEVERKHEELGEEMTFEKRKFEKLEKEKREIEGRLSEATDRQASDDTLTNLKRENKLLRESLEDKNKKLNQLSKNLGVIKTVFDKYADLIEQREAKTAEQLKRLVQPDNHGIKEIIRAYRTPKDVFEFVRDNISEVSPNISATYWLSIEEMLRLRAADTEDESILLCSLLRALGEDAKVIVVELDRGMVKTLVTTNDRVLDPSIKSKYDSYTGLTEEDALKKYIFDGQFVKRVRYQFNDREYKSFEETG